LVTKNDELTVKRQCELLEVNRSSMYYEPKKPTEEEILREEYIKSRLDFWHTKYCWMGSRKLLKKLVQDDKITGIGRQLVRRYMREMDIFAVYPKPDTPAPKIRSDAAHHRVASPSGAVALKIPEWWLPHYRNRGSAAAE
jgi:hypothetical protein